MKYVLMIFQGPTHAHFARFGSLEGVAGSGTGGDLRGLRGDLQGGGRRAGASVGTRRDDHA
jgi:hypothetical protein